jgi:hypothetical protein
MGWTSFWVGREATRKAELVVPFSSFVAHCDDLVAGAPWGKRPVWETYPYFGCVAYVSGLFPASPVTLVLRLPWLHLGGFAAGSRRFRFLVGEDVLAGGPGMVRAVADSHGFKHTNVAGWRWIEKSCCVPSTGIVQWHTVFECAWRWIRRDFVVGWNGMQATLADAQVWV